MNLAPKLPALSSPRLVVVALREQLKVSAQPGRILFQLRREFLESLGFLTVGRRGLIPGGLVSNQIARDLRDDILDRADHLVENLGGASLDRLPDRRAG